MALKWDKIYSVNVKEIDEQHKKIFSIIDRVHCPSGKNIDDKGVLEIIKELKDYGNYHLDTEEKYFKELNYPNADAHIDQHNKYRKKILELERDIESLGKEEARIQLSDFLRDWWIRHIQTMDQKYSDFLNENGLY